MNVSTKHSKFVFICSIYNLNTFDNNFYIFMYFMIYYIINDWIHAV